MDNNKHMKKKSYQRPAVLTIAMQTESMIATTGDGVKATISGYDKSNGNGGFSQEE